MQLFPEHETFLSSNSYWSLDLNLGSQEAFLLPYRVGHLRSQSRWAFLLSLNPSGLSLQGDVSVRVWLCPQTM